MTFSGLFLGDSREQVLISALTFYGKVNGFSGLVWFLSSLDQVSLGTAHEQSVSMARLFDPLTILKRPFSPQ